MSAKADWIVVAGFLLAMFGLSLRIFMMMRSSDTHAVDASPKPSRVTLRSYNTAFPKSRLPLLMRTSLYTGVVLLIVGLFIEFR